MVAMSKLLTDALVILRDDAPVACYRIGLNLGDLVVRIAVEGERFTVRGTTVRADGHDADCEGSVEVCTSRKTVLELARGHLGVNEAIYCRQLFLRGPVGSLLRVARSVSAFAEGAVRSHRMEELLHEFQKDENQRRRMIM